MFFKFTIQTDAQISTIKAIRTASRQTASDNYCWSLKFSKDVVEGGVVTQTPDECQKFIRILILAKKAIKEDVYMGNAADFTWTVEEYKPLNETVYWCTKTRFIQ